MLDAAAAVPRDDNGFYDDTDSSGSSGSEAEGTTAEARKGKNLASAFEQIMQKTRTGKDAVAPILVGRKHLAEKELAEEEELEARQSKKMRQAMRKRGHLKVPRRGKDTEHDVREKSLTKLATKGVVRLFNAVAKAQQAQRDSELIGKTKALQSRDDFFQQLKGDGGGNSMNQKVGQLMSAATGKKKEQHSWSVLNDEFTLTGGTKMKDWDREAEEEAGMPREELDVSHSDEDEDGEGGEGLGGGSSDEEEESGEEESKDEEEEEEEESKYD